MSLIHESTKNYFLTNNESIFYIFQIDIYSHEKITIRRIKNTPEGNLLNIDDNILNHIHKIKFSIFDINIPNDPIIIKKKFYFNPISTFTINSKNVILTISSLNNRIIVNYKFV